MRKLRFINGNGTEIDLTSYPFGITTWEGFSNVDLEIQSQKVPYTDGSVYLDSLLNERDLSVTLAINDEKDLSVRYELEDTIRKVLNPKLGEGYLYYQNDYLQRRIKVIPKVPLFPTHNSNDSGTVKASLSFTACIPYWEDVEETTVTLNSYEQKVINNNGDVPCSIQLEGINTNSPFRLFNNTTGKKIATKEDIALSLRLNTGLGEKSFEKGGFAKVFENGIMGRVRSITFNPITNQYVMLTDNGIWVCDDEENWYLKNGNYSGIGFVFYDEDNNNYIVGVDNTIYTTEDLITLTQVATFSGPSKIWKIDGLYIVQSYYGSIYYGTDLSSLSSLYNEWSYTAFKKNDSIYVIGSEYTHIYSSGSWTSTSHGMTVTNACNNGDYVVIQTSNGLYYSNDYTTWTQITSDTSAKNPIYSSILEKWIYTDSTTLHVSTDLSTWETQSIDWGGVDLLFIETRENKELIFVQRPSDYSNDIKQIKTTDLTNFTISDIGYYYSSTVSYMTQDENSLYLAIGRSAGGKCYIYKKTTSWELVTTLDGVSLDNFKYIAETNKFLILDTSHTKVYVSGDFENWDTYSISACNVTYANGQYVFVGLNGIIGNGAITITTDFTDIQTYSFLNTNHLYNINYCNGYYYIVCNGGIAYSSDAITWAWLYQVSLIIYSNPNVSCVSNNKLYVVRSNSVIVVDGLNYKVISFVLDTSYSRIFYSDIYNCFILVGTSESYITTDFQTAYTLPFAFTSLEEFENEIYIAKNALCFSLEIDTENAISELTTDSDMTLGLEVGENKLTITGQIDGVYYLTYRQQYLGV